MSETRKLYYEDVYMKEFTAKVLECREAGKGCFLYFTKSLTLWTHFPQIT